MDSITRRYLPHSGLVYFFSVQDYLWQNVDVYEGEVSIRGYDHKFRTLDQAKALHAMLGMAIEECTMNTQQNEVPRDEDQ